MSSSASHVVLQVTAGIGGAALTALGVIQKQPGTMVAGVTMILGALAGSHAAQIVESKAPAIQSGVSKAEQLLPIVMPLLPKSVADVVKTGDAVLDEVIAAVVAASAQQAGQAAGATAAAKPAAGGPSQA